MLKEKKLCFAAMCCAMMLIPFGAACNTNLADLLDELDLDDLEINIYNSVNDVQVVDPRDEVIPGGNTIVLQPEVIFVDDISDDLDDSSLPDITLLAWENQTGFDLYLEYAVDGILQSIFVFDGETIFLEYPCLFDIELLLEEDYDPLTGQLVFFDDTLPGTIFFNPDDFICGDAVIFTFIDDIFLEIIPLI
jgi:hypothetical protein